MIWSAGAVVGILIYALIVLADLTLIGLCFFAGRTRRWLLPLALALNAIPVVLLAIGVCSALVAMRTNADAGLAAVAAGAMAIPFLACFVACAILWYLRRELRPPQDKGATPAAAQERGHLSS